MVSCEFCEIFRNSFSYGIPPVVAFGPATLRRMNLYIFTYKGPYIKYVGGAGAEGFCRGHEVF